MSYPYLSNKRKMSFVDYRRLDKSLVKDVRIVLSDPEDFNDFGGVEVTFKQAGWRGGMYG